MRASIVMIGVVYAARNSKSSRVYGEISEISSILL